MQETLYFTSVVNRRVLDASGTAVGVVVDLVVVSGDLFPRITGLVIRPSRSGSRLFLSLESVEDPGANPLRLKENAQEMAPLHLEEGEARLGHTFLDKQIVDTRGVRVVRINDLKLAVLDSELCLLGADIGIASLFRRVHAERTLQWLARPLHADVTDHVIPWNFVDPLSRDKVQLNVTRGRLREMRPADLADVLEQLPAAARHDALAHLTDEQIADTLSETRLDVQRAIISEMEDERASDILEHMAPDDATDLLQHMEVDRREDLLERMDVEDREEITHLLTYAKDTAGGLMTTEMVLIPVEASAEEAIRILRHLEPDAETVFYLYIVDTEGRLGGVVSLRNLVIAAPETPVRTLANTRVHRVHVEDDQEHVAEMISRYNLLALPVVDDREVLKGIVTVDDVIDVLREETAEDISLISSGSPTAPEGSRDWHVLSRIGWLLLVLLSCVGLGLGALRFLPSLGPGRSLPFLLLGVPLLLEVSNSLALQAATTISREAAEVVSLRAMKATLWSEWVAGSVIAALSAGLGGLLCFLLPGLPAAARLCVPAALFCGFFYAVLCGVLLPPVLHRLLQDPTRGLRPLLTLLVTIGSTVIYFGVLHGLVVV